MKFARKVLSLLLTTALMLTAIPALDLGLLLPASASEAQAMVTINVPTGATVTLDGVVGINNNGTVTFDKAPGRYAFSVTMPGYESILDTLTFTKNCVVDCDLAKTESNILSGVSISAYSAAGYYGGIATPDKACNGNYSDGWQSADKTPGDYIQFMFNGEKTVGTMTLYWERGSRPSKSNDGYTVQYTTDGETWQTYGSTSYTYAADTSHNGVDGDMVNFGKLTATGLRVVVDGYATWYSPKLYEVAVGGATSSFTVTEGGTKATVGSVAAQISQPDGDKLRLLAAVDSLNYRNAGFEITVAEAETDSDYSHNEVYEDAYSVESERFGIEDGYLFAMVITDLPERFSLRVRPYVTDLTGQRIYGRMTTVARGRGGELTVRPTEAYYIESGWELARVPDVSDNGATVSQNSYSTGSVWIDAVVPGTVLTSYHEAGLIEDPNVDDNILDLDEAYYNVDYWYRSTFTAPSDLEGKRVWLNFDGINWKANIYLNGTYLGDLNGAFIRGKYDVTDYLNVGGKNSLAVYLYWCNGDVADMPSFLCTKSWDFMPAIPGRDVGVYKDVYFTTSDDVTLQDAYVETDLPLPDTSSAKATVSTFVQNSSSSSVTGTLSGVIRRDDDTGATYAVTKEITLAAGEKKEVFFDPLTMENPDLWWPNGSGEQPLYKLTLTFTTDGVVSDTTVTTFGVREYTYSYTAGNMILAVNGRDILIRGGNWAVPDNLLDFSDADYETAVRMHKDMGFNMIRNWHGANDFASFYKYCDKYGILVFEDFWLNGYEVPDDHDMFMSNVEDKVLRLRSHASLAIWCGENEAKPWGPYDVEIPATIAQYDYEDRIYIAASNEGAVSGGINYALQTPKWYFENAAKFCTELGSTVIPTYYSVQRMMDESNQTIDSVSESNSAWDIHGWNGGVGNKIVWDYKNAVTDRYGGTSNFATFCDICQLTNYETYRAMFEAWNDGMFETTQGMLLWMSHPTWGSVLWQVYDAYQAQTGGYYGSKIACEEIHVQWNASTNAIKVINTTEKAVSGTVSVKLYNLDGTVKYTGNYSMNAASDKATYVADMSKPDGLSDTFFLDLELRDGAGNILSQNFYWIDKNGGVNYTAMKDMAKATLAAETSVETHVDGTATMTVTLTNNSSVCAVAVDMTLLKSVYATGEDPRVLPAWYEDNWFSLTPGETRTLTIDYDIADLNGASPVLEIGGFNLNGLTVIPGGGAIVADSDISGEGTAFDCGVEVYDGTHVSTRINDGDASTGYQPQNFTAGDYCGLTFGKTYTLSSLTLYWETADYIHSYADGGYKIYFRVNGNWVEATGLATGRSGATDTIVLSAPVVTDGVKVEFLSQPDGKYAPQLMELEVYGH